MFISRCSPPKTVWRTEIIFLLQYMGSEHRKITHGGFRLLPYKSEFCNQKCEILHREITKVGCTSQVAQSTVYLLQAEPLQNVTSGWARLVGASLWAKGAERMRLSQSVFSRWNLQCLFRSPIAFNCIFCTFPRKVWTGS